MPLFPLGKSCSQSQNSWAWKGSLKVTWSNLLIKQRHLEPIVQLVFYYLHSWRLHHHSGQPAPVFGHPHSGKVFSEVQMEPHVFPFLPIASCHVMGRSLTESSSHASLKVFIYIDKIPTESSLAQRRLFWTWLHFPCYISALTMGKISPWVFAHVDKDTTHLWTGYNF